MFYFVNLYFRLIHQKTNGIIVHFAHIFVKLYKKLHAVDNKLEIQQGDFYVFEKKLF